MGLQKHKRNYLFIADAIIELQMFQGCQNWSWISQGVLGSNFIALPGNQGAWAIQLYLNQRFRHIFIDFPPLTPEALEPTATLSRDPSERRWKSV